MIDGKIMVMAGLVEDDDSTSRPSTDVYEYDLALNRFTLIAF